MSPTLDLVQLGDVAELQNGYAFKSELFSNDPHGIPLVKGSNLGHQEIKWAEGPWWPRADGVEYENFRLTTGDVVIAMDRPIVRGQLKYSWISDWEPNALLVQRVCRLRGEPCLDQGFLRYVVGSPGFLRHVEKITTGVNVPHISGGDIQRFEFLLPPLQVQRRVAGILSAYDDLIENNNRRMSLLEESIHLLYREWFIYLRFPGRGRTKVVDGVPKGWQSTTIGEVCEVFDGPHATPALVDEGPVFLGIKNITPDGRLDLTDIRHISEDEFPSWTKRVTPRPGDIVFTYEATLHRYAVIPSGFRGCLGRRMGLLRPRSPALGVDFLFPMLRSPTWTSYMETEKLQGATVDRISIKKFPSFRILVPSAAILEDFVSMSKFVLDQRNTLREQNRLFQEARDLLLPRLMDGRIPV
jgi:type I restriction enzyme S subunit